MMTPAEFEARYGDEIKELESKIRSVPDFPKPGINFRDIGPMLRSRHSLYQASYLLSELLKHEQGIKSGDHLTIAGVESRGFIFGAAMAARMSCGFEMVRKKGKLPGKVHGLGYDNEYRGEAIEVQEHEDEMGSVVVLDDVLATGGTAVAAVNLLRKAGHVVTGCVFLIELVGLRGRDQLKEVGVHVSSLIKY